MLIAGAPPSERKPVTGRKHTTPVRYTIESQKRPPLPDVWYFGVDSGPYDKPQREKLMRLRKEERATGAGMDTEGANTFRLASSGEHQEMRSARSGARAVCCSKSVGAVGNGAP